MATTESPFEQLPLARTASHAAVLTGQYRIYTDQKNFTLVQAESAVNAIETCGIENVFKIEREALHKNTLIMPNFSHAVSASPS